MITNKILPTSLCYGHQFHIQTKLSSVIYDIMPIWQRVDAKIPIIFFATQRIKNCYLQDIIPYV